jgi:uncharacterized membrane protein
VTDLPLSTLDVAAVAWFLASVGGYRLITERGPLARRSIVAAVQRQRVAWMVNMGGRENRMLDAVLLGTLSQGNAFFASTSAIAIGGLSALLASGDKLQGLMEQLPLAVQSNPVLWQLKVLFLVGICIYAFFKFAWAFRLSHYVAIMIGATPASLEPDHPGRDSHAVRTARLIGIAGEHSNGGIRALYYAIAAMAWFFHPLAFIGAVTWVLAIMIRRDFFSRSLRIVATPE